MKQLFLSLVILIAGLGFVSCDNEDSEEPMLIVKFKFDPNQARLNNIGAPAPVAAGNAAQSPVFNSISSHYLELAPNQYHSSAKALCCTMRPKPHWAARMRSISADRKSLLKTRRSWQSR